MKTIAIVNQKGGCGKTTTAHSIGGALKKRGERVLFVDLDSQCNLTYSLGGEIGDGDITDALETPSSVRDIIQETEQGDLIAGSPDLSRLNANYRGREDMERLKEALKPIKRGYDHIIIDTPPSLGALMVNALTSCDGALVVAQADIFSLQGVGQLMGTLQEVKDNTNSKLKILGLALTRYNERARLSKKLLTDLEAYTKDIGINVLDTKIRECVALREAQLNRKSIFEHAGKSNGAKDYEALLDELIKEGL